MSALRLTAVAFLFVSGCFNPLVMRRAQTLEPGQVEVVLAPELTTAMGLSDGSFLPLADGGPGKGNVSTTFSARVGLVDNVDIQLKMDPTVLYPELDVTYQLVERRGLAVSILAGGRYVFGGRGSSAVSVFYVPVAVLIDVPLNDNDVIYGAFGLTGGLSVAPHGTFTQLSPRVALGFSFEFFDWLLLQPELAMQQTFHAVGDRPVRQRVVGITHASLGLGIGARF